MFLLASSLIAVYREEEGKKQIRFNRSQGRTPVVTPSNHVRFVLGPRGKTRTNNTIL